MTNNQNALNIDLIKAIKTAVQVTQSANKSGGKPNAEILNEVAAKMGFKDYRALNQRVKSASHGVEKPLAFAPFALVQEAYDEEVDRVSLEIDVNLAARLLELSKGAASMKTAVPYADWHETSLGNRSSVAVRPVLDTDGSVFLEAEVFDKHSSSAVSVQGEIDLKQLLDFVSGDSQHADSLDPAQWFLWKADTREFFLFSDIDSNLVERIISNEE